jgi:hypothetical protein
LRRLEQQQDLPPDMASMCLPFDCNETPSLNPYVPSTPTLSHDSPLIPTTSLDAFHGGFHRHQQSQNYNYNYSTNDRLLPQVIHSPARENTRPLVPQHLYPGQQMPQQQQQQQQQQE